MRKLLCRSSLLAILMVVFLTVTAFALEPNDGYVNVNALRLRSEPSTSAATITYLNSGDQLTILADEGEWYQVSTQEYTGYVYAAYVTTHEEQAARDAALQESVANKTGVILANDVNFRTGPSTENDVLTTLNQGAEVTVVSISGEWVQVQHDGQAGYVNAAYVTVDGLPLRDPKGTVTGSCVNVRSIPSTDGSILTKVYAGKMVDLLALEDGWYSVSVDGTKGYIRADYIRVYMPGAASSTGAEIVAKAQDYMGARYAYGGASPKGFDCSGFTMYVYSLFGYSLPHSATSQWQNSGTYVERSDLQAGDLVLFCDPSQSNGKACSHVGIYISDGNFIHATSSRTGRVKINNLSESYYNNYYVGAKRVA